MVQYSDNLLHSVFILLVTTDAFVVLTYVHVIVVGQLYVYCTCTFV